MCLLLTVDAIRRVNSQTAIELVIPYFPYARQDRVCSSGDALSLKVMANLINNLNCQRITVVDPHSDVTLGLVNNISVVTQAEIILKSGILNLKAVEKLDIISPDAGAEKKVHSLTRDLSTKNIEVEVLCARKSRDIRTGKIISTEINGVKKVRAT
jgi:ribose-phosphate pyrophosphokinase